MQIYVKDDAHVTDLQVLTVQVTDVNEPPQFQGNLAQGETYPDNGIREDPEGQTEKVNEQAAAPSERQLLTEQEECDVFLGSPSHHTQQI